MKNPGTKKSQKRIIVLIAVFMFVDITYCVFPNRFQSDNTEGWSGREGIAEDEEKVRALRRGDGALELALWNAQP